ncbi:MAG: hypothetical protein HDR43_01815 [Mycoplasma sp.]|nr:hypothetical protein [Mycoplasma sp.]
MKFKVIKNLFAPLAVTTTIASPILVASCLSLPTGSINKEEQSTLLSSDAAKITLLDSWLTTTYVSLYVDSIVSTIDSSSTKETVSNTFKYYLDYLTWPTSNEGSFAGSTAIVKFGTVTEEQKTTFENLLKDAYKFYIAYKSTIKESTENSVSPILYFSNKSLEWKKSELNTLVEIKDSTNNNILTINDFNPGLGYTGVDSSNNVIENDFKILMSTRGTEVYQNVMKLLLSEMYFLNATEQQVKNGTNYNKMTRNPASVDYINTRAYAGQNSNDFKTYMLKKYLIENTPQFLWSYTSEDYSTTTTVASIISTQLEFNNLKTTKETTLSSTLAPASTESTSNTLTKLQAFDSIQFNSNSDSTNDLSSSIDNLKMFGDSKIGLLDTEKQMLFSFTELNAIKEARKHNKTNTTNNYLSIPSINIKDSSSNKKSHSITVDDLDVKWANGITTQTGSSFENTNGNIKQKLIINLISYTPSDGENKNINVSFTYSFNIPNSSTPSTKADETTNEYSNSFNYNFSISNWGENDSSQSNVFSNEYVFSGEENQVGIKIFDQSSPTGISYYLRVLPLWKNNGSIQIGGNNWYAQGYWTFDRTPWASLDEQRKLIYFFTLSDSDLYTKIQDFYLYNNYNIQGSAYELTSLVSSLGLTKKTDADRRDEGIIW